MIVNKMPYVYQHTKAKERGTVVPDRSFLLSTFQTQLKQKYKDISDVLAIVSDNEWRNILQRAELIGITQTGHLTPNTAVGFKLPGDAKIRGPFTLLYDRITLNDYFGIDEILRRMRQDELTIEYDHWVSAVQKGTLNQLLHAKVTHYFGRALSSQGRIFIGIGNQEAESGKMTYQGDYPFALIVPSLSQINEGWPHMANIIETVPKGTLTYQVLDVRLRLVASNHLFVEDGEVMIQVRLMRPLKHYHAAHEEVDHVD